MFIPEQPKNQEHPQKTRNTPRKPGTPPTKPGTPQKKPGTPQENPEHPEKNPRNLRKQMARQYVSFSKLPPLIAHKMIWFDLHNLENIYKRHTGTIFFTGFPVRNVSVSDHE